MEGSIAVKDQQKEENIATWSSATLIETICKDLSCIWRAPRENDIFSSSVVAIPMVAAAGHFVDSYSAVYELDILIAAILMRFMLLTDEKKNANVTSDDPSDDGKKKLTNSSGNNATREEKREEREKKKDGVDNSKNDKDEVDVTRAPPSSTISLSKMTTSGETTKNEIKRIEQYVALAKLGQGIARAMSKLRVECRAALELVRLPSGMVSPVIMRTIKISQKNNTKSSSSENTNNKPSTKTSTSTVKKQEDQAIEGLPIYARGTATCWCYEASNQQQESFMNPSSSDSIGGFANRYTQILTACPIHKLPHLGGILFHPDILFFVGKYNAIVMLYFAAKDEYAEMLVGKRMGSAGEWGQHHRKGMELSHVTPLDGSSVFRREANFQPTSSAQPPHPSSAMHTLSSTIEKSAVLAYHLRNLQPHPAMIPSQPPHSTSTATLLNVNADDVVENVKSKKEDTTVLVPTQEKLDKALEMYLEGGAEVGENEMRSSFGVSLSSILPIFTMSQLSEIFCGACIGGHLHLVREILAEDRSCVVRPSHGRTPIEHGLFSLDVDKSSYNSLLATLVQSGAEIPQNALTYRGPLDHPQSIPLLLQCGAEIHAANSDGMCALHLASRDGKLLAASKLLFFGKAPDIRDSVRGFTALHHAAMSPVYQTRPLEEEKDAERIGDNDGESKTKISDEEKKRRSAEEVVERDPFGFLSPHYLPPSPSRHHQTQRQLSHPLPSIVPLLTGHGADVNAADHFGRTPLHLAALAGNVDMVIALLAHGASAGRRDMRGLTPVDVALKEGSSAEVLSVLSGQATVVNIPVGGQVNF